VFARPAFFKFLALSTLLHAGVMVFATQRAPALPSSRGLVLSATLDAPSAPAQEVSATPAPPREAPPAAAPAPPKPVSKRARAKPAPRALTAPAGSARVAALEAQPVNEPPAPATPLLAPVPRAETPAPAAAATSTPEAPQQLALAQPSAASAATSLPTPKELLGSLPKMVEIDYDTRRGEGPVRVGTMKLSWRRDGDRYDVSTLTHTETAEEHDDQGAHLERVQFDRGANAPEDGSDEANKARPLTGNAQDLLSFLFQVHAAPATTGHKPEIYEYEVADTEIIAIGGVELETLRLRLRPRDGQSERSIEVWLATGSHHLPVKIRVSEKGHVIEQIATNIRVE
jgi:hypothetical protein